MNKLTCAIALAFGLVAGQSAYAGIPVVDGVNNSARAAEFVKTVAQWSKEIAEMQQQYQMLTNQYNQLQRSYASANGIRDWANVANNTYDKVGSWGDKMSSVDYTVYKDTARILGIEDAPFDSTSGAAVSMTNVQNTNAYNQALNEENYARIKSRQNNLQTLLSQVNNASDEKDIQDLHTRISAEQAMLANEQNTLLATAQLQQGQRDTQQQQDRERLIKMADIVNLTPDN